MQRDERCYKKVASFFENFQYIAHTGCSVFINVKFVNTISSRAHVYAYNTGVFAFLLSQVSQDLRNSLVINMLHQTTAYFNKSLLQITQIRWTKLEKVRFCFVIFPKKIGCFGVDFSLGVTLVTAKKQHCGWNARAKARTFVRDVRVRRRAHK